MDFVQDSLGEPVPEKNIHPLTPIRNILNNKQQDPDVGNRCIITRVPSQFLAVSVLGAAF